MVLTSIALVRVIAIISAELARLASGWPVNATCYPPVVGPGDSATISFDQTLNTVKSHWRCNFQAKIVAPGNFATLPLRVANRINNLGQRMRVKSSEKNATVTPWVVLTFPVDPALAGDILDITVGGQASYPIMMGNSAFTDGSTPLSRQLSITMAPPGAGKSHQTLALGGGWGGVAVLALGGFLLARSARSSRSEALPTEVSSIGDGEASRAEPPPLDGPRDEE
jgi:hypothetical protein